MSSVVERVGQRYLTPSGKHIYRVVRADAGEYEIKLEECIDQQGCWGRVEQHPTAQGSGTFVADTVGFDIETAMTPITWLEG